MYINSNDGIAVLSQIMVGLVSISDPVWWPGMRSTIEQVDILILKPGATNIIPYIYSQWCNIKHKHTSI